MKRFITAAFAALILAAPLAAAAQDMPSYAVSPAGQPGDEQIRGRITSFDGGYNLEVRDERGFIDNVTLHPGTIINPTGLTLEPGMTVSILGYNSGSAFSANEIDTPYTYDAGVPYYLGHPWDYYGPSVSLGFFFGGDRGWWHGNAFRGGYSYSGGARYYASAHIQNVYRNSGTFHGRDVVAPREHGGYYHGAAQARAGGFHGGGHEGGHGGGGGHEGGHGGGGHDGGGHVHR
jgi:hypothetical protein